MAGWKVRTHDPRDKEGEEEWCIDSGEIFLISGRGNKAKAAAEQVADLLNQAGVTRLLDTSYGRDVLGALEKIYSATFEIERAFHGIKVDPNTQLYPVISNNEVIRALATQLIKKAQGF